MSVAFLPASSNWPFVSTNVRAVVCPETRGSLKKCAQSRSLLCLSADKAAGGDSNCTYCNGKGIIQCPVCSGEGVLGRTIPCRYCIRYAQNKDGPGPGVLPCPVCEAESMYEWTYREESTVDQMSPGAREQSSME